MRHRADFVAVTRRGRRAATLTMVVHLLPAPATPADAEAPARSEALVGFVVGRAVGGSVVRHRVTRRLRAQVGARLDAVPAGSRLVVRALPPAASATSVRLGQDLDAGLDRLLTPVPA